MSVPFTLPPDAAARLAMLANAFKQSEYRTPSQSEPVHRPFTQSVEDESDE